MTKFQPENSNTQYYNNCKKEIIELPLNTIGKITYVTIEDFL